MSLCDEDTQISLDSVLLCVCVCVTHSGHHQLDPIAVQKLLFHPTLPYLGFSPLLVLVNVER